MGDYAGYSGVMNSATSRIETIRQALSRAKTDLHNLKQSGASTEVLADAEATVRVNQRMLERAEQRDN
jgi:hypothetical protein